ncbi:lantibiotic dehydratase family protein [Flavobacterium sp. 3HN19-14]|uniref:lantibiotic dehydratase family protein n=1 Tax=Flavobacterium sp. 3HN19-14 TaxID=3448133 RepID=UPI003EE15EC0
MSLLKYALRSATRCTPFGLFSGVGVIDSSFFNNSVDATGQILITGNHQFSRLDYTYACRLMAQLNSSYSIRRNLNYYVNNTLYNFSNSYRYIDYSAVNGGRRKYELIQVAKNEYLSKILKKAKSGCSFNYLVMLLMDEGFDNSESESYIHQLIDSKILISELEPSTIGKSLEEKAWEIINKYSIRDTSDDELKMSFSFLNTIKTTLRDIDSKSIEASLSQTESFLSGNPNALSETLLYKDLFTSVEGQLSENQNNLVQEGLDIFRLLVSVDDLKYKTRLHTFRDLFSATYESETVSLLHALDVETGIGYDDTLRSAGIDSNFLINNFPKTLDIPTDYTEWETFDAFIANKIERAIVNLNDKVEITAAEITALRNAASKKNKKHLSATGIIRFSLYKDSDQNDFIYIDSLGTSSPNKILGRFSNGSSEIKNLAREVAAFEDGVYDDMTIIAEIDHLPYDGFGNTLMRADLNRHIITYHGGTHEDSKAISIADLYLTYRNEELILTSKKLKKRIIPYFSNAYNDDFPNTLPIFKFLLDLHYQYEDRQKGYLSVNKYHKYFKHIPRLTYNNIILSKESWLVKRKRFQRLFRYGSRYGGL